MENQICKIDEINIEKAPSIYVEDGLKPFIKMVKDEVSDQVVDLSTEKGRKEIAGLAYKVSKSKTAVEKCGREYLKKLKEQPKIIEKELREFISEMDLLRDETRKPLTEWEEEQKRIKAEEEAKAESERLAAQRESDHEIAILLDEKYNKELEEAKAEKERQRIAYEQQLKEEAAKKAEQEKLEAIEREKAAQARALIAEKQAEEAKQKAINDAIEAKKLAEKNAKKAAEDARLAEIERQKKQAEQEKAEQERLEKDRAHKGKVLGESKDDLVAALGIDEDTAKSVIKAIAKKQIRNISITY